MSALFLSEANKLKNLQLYLEKNDNLLNYISKYGNGLNILDYFVNLAKNRQTETDKINNELKDIWRELCAKKKLLHEGDVNAVDLRCFKQEMIEIQEKIQFLKMQLSLNIEKLKDQETNMWEMNCMFNQKLSEWEKPTKISFSYGFRTLKTTHTQNNTDYKEVLEFMDFVNKSNGHENGWSSEDHQLFLKLRRKYKNREQLAINLNKLLPDISTNAIMQHETWFIKYTFLKNKKDEALEKWRKDKKENVCQNFNEGCIPVIKSKLQVRSKDEDIYEKIAVWKANKKSKRQQEDAHDQMKREREKLIEQEKRRFHYQVKRAVVEWKENKTAKEQNERIQKELEELHEKRIKAVAANRMIKHYQSQDDMFVARMRSNKLKDENETKKRSKSSYLVDRDPERILKPTKQWLLRTTRDNYVKEVSTYVPNIREVPKLKIPEWRKNH